MSKRGMSIQKKRREDRKEEKRRKKNEKYKMKLVNGMKRERNKEINERKRSNESD